jgi:membrane associated rhomboid family serine protease
VGNSVGRAAALHKGAGLAHRIPRLDAAHPTRPQPPTAPPSVAHAPPRRPWEAPELFSPRSPETEFGYVANRQRFGCTREELIARCRAARPHVDLVWTPESPRLVPPAEVPWLVDAVRDRTRADLVHNLKNGIGLTAVWGGLAVLQAMKGYPVPLLVVLVLLLGVVPALQPAWALWRLRRRPVEYPRELATTFRYQVWLGTRRMTTTWLVAGCLIVVGLTQVLAGSRLIARVKRPLGLGDVAHSMTVGPVIESAAMVKDAVRAGEVWRLLTAELMHGHPLHFLFNFMALLAVGRLVEMHGHPLYVPAVFLFSALCASAASFLFSAALISVGASGGIMGLIGFLAVIGIRRRHVVPRGFLKSIAMSIALTAATGLVAYRFIDNAAHAGGLVGGILLGLVYVQRRTGRSQPDDSATVHLNASTLAKAAGWVSAAALVVATLATVWLLLASTRVYLQP